MTDGPKTENGSFAHKCGCFPIPSELLATVRLFMLVTLSPILSCHSNSFCDVACSNQARNGTRTLRFLTTGGPSVIQTTDLNC